jgi:hypothetical protein
MSIRSAAIAAVLGITAVAIVAAFPAAQRAPVEPGVCSRLSEDGEEFTVVGRDIENLETCGARLEAVRLLTDQPVSGAFQGVYVFADETGIRVGPTLDGPHRELISAADRARIDAAINELIRRRAEDQVRQRRLSLELAPS